MSILVPISENLDFAQNLRKLLIKVKIFEISRFWYKFSTNLDFVKKKKRFENLNFGQIFESSHIRSNFRKISIDVKL